ncbi:type II secretion system protein GspC [Ferrimonas pelagia]|uniref:Type II secretion system protein GspC n=1 Tax=Ferrimonas pelagia TaxID=1177826 RepID=A0ABP9F9Q8_9GAMM
MAKILTLILVVCSLYLAALMTWQLLPEPGTDTANWRPTPQQGGQSGNVSLAPLLSLKLFGTPDAKPEVATPEPVARDLITDAPKTSLRILLTGLVASSIEERGIAIIESGGSQETYSIGEKIKSTNASLHEVYADRAIILNQGRYETLMLDGMEYTREMSNETQRLREPRPSSQASSGANQAVAQVREALLADPGKITDFISFSPVRSDGALRGYRLNPGREGRELFMASGLKPNDIAVSVNGYDLTNLAEAAQLMGELQELTDASLMVERDGQLTQIDFALPSQ